jgi:hypothetical protein
LVLLFIGIFSLASALWVPPIRAQQTTGLRMTVEAGFAGRFRSDQWTPLLIRVANDGPSLRGELRVVSGGAIRLTTGGYSTPIDLPTQSSKLVFLYVELAVFNQNVQVELATESGAIAATLVTPMSRLSGTDLLYALISEAPTGSIDLTNIASSSGVVQADLSLDSIPPLAQALESIDLLVFTDVDTGKLSLDRRQAIENWVLSGGHLVITGGPNWQKTRAGFDSLVPLIPTGTITLASLNGLANFIGTGDTPQTPTNGVISINGTVTTGAQVLASQDELPLMIRRDYGLGTINYLTIDPSLEPIRSWAQRGAIWTTVFQSIKGRPGWAEGITDANEATRAVTYTRALRLPDVAQLATFLILYILVIGPGNYIVLRLLRRLEWAWVSIPVIIIGTSVAAYLVGSNLRGTLPIVSRMSIVQQFAGESRARLDGVASVLSPRRANYTVVASEGIAMRPIVDSGTNTIKVEEGARYIARNIAVDSGLSANFYTSAYIQAIPLEGTATVTLRNERVFNVKGEVKNNSALTLTELVVFCVNTPAVIGNLAPGESKAFDFDIDPLPYAAPGYALAPVASNPFGVSRGGRNFSQQVALPNLLMTGFRRARAEDNVTDRNERRRRELFAAAMTNENERGSARGLTVYVGAWHNGAPIQVGLDNAAFNTEDLTLYIAELTTTITPPTSSSLRIPAGLTMWSPVDRTRVRDSTPYDIYLFGTESPSFRYTPIPELPIKAITGFTLQAERNANTGSAIFALWDWKAGLWIDLPALSSGSRIETYTIDSATDLARYLAPDRSVRLQVRAPLGNATYTRVEVVFNAAF